MSGPKDFVILFAAARLIQIEARRRSEQRARKAAAEARLAQQRKIAEKRMAEMAALRAAIEEESRKRASATKASLAEQRQTIARRTAENLAHPQKASGRKQRNKRTQEADSVSQEQQDTDASTFIDATTKESETSDASTRTAVSNAFAIIDELSGLSDTQAQTAAEKLSGAIAALEESQDTRANVLQRLAHIQSEAKEEHEAAVGRARRLPEMVQQIICWQAELSRDEAVGHFCRDRASEWQTQAVSLLSDHNGGQSTDLLLERCQKLFDQAERISQDAGKTQAAFATRNELLTDVVASLQEIGFFVSDPNFENPNDPAGPVSVKATRGSEEISASIDLTDTVRSTWNGIGEERCKDAFFQYVDQMKAKGIEVKPTRADLQDRPQLKQKGARSLPNSEQRRRGK